MSGDHNNSGNDNGGTQDGDNSSTKHPLKWDASDLKKMNSYADKAAEWAKKAILLAKTYGRKNVSDKIIASGYDAAEMGKRMRRIYEQQ